MTFMGFIGFSRHGRVPQMCDDPAQVVFKRRARNPSNIFKQKCSRGSFSHCSNCFGPHVTRVFLATMLASNRKRLAWRTASNQVQFSSVRCPRNFTNVTLLQRPVFYVAQATILVMGNCKDCILIPFDHEIVLESGAGEAQRQPTTPTKKFDAPHLVSNS